MGIKSIAVALLMYKSLLQLSSLPEISMCTSSKPRNSYKDLGFEAKTLNSKFSIRSAHSRLHKDRPTNTMLGFQRRYTLESKLRRLSKLLKSIHTQSPISVDQAHCFFSWELRRSQKLRPIELRENRVSKVRKKTYQCSRLQGCCSLLPLPSISGGPSSPHFPSHAFLPFPQTERKSSEGNRRRRRKRNWEFGRRKSRGARSRWTIAAAATRRRHAKLWRPHSSHRCHSQGAPASRSPAFIQTDKMDVSEQGERVLFSSKGEDTQTKLTSLSMQP